MCADISISSSLQRCRENYIQNFISFDYQESALVIACLPNAQLYITFAAFIFPNYSMSLFLSTNKRARKPTSH